MTVKVEAAIFNIIAVFCVIAAVVYGLWSREPIGTTALVLSAGLTGLIGGFFWFVSRRIDARPEDRKDADIAEGAGELGFFSPGSYWPFGLALSAATMGLALAFWCSWLILIALAALLITMGGPLFDYYVGQNAQQSGPRPLHRGPLPPRAGGALGGCGGGVVAGSWGGFSCNGLCKEPRWTRNAPPARRSAWRCRTPDPRDLNDARDPPV